MFQVSVPIFDYWWGILAVIITIAVAVMSWAKIGALTRIGSGLRLRLRVRVRVRVGE